MNTVCLLSKQCYFLKQFKLISMSELVELLVVKLPADMEEKIVELHRFVLRARRRHDYQFSHILNTDEPPMRFELPATRTLGFTGFSSP